MSDLELTIIKYLLSFSCVWNISMALMMHTKNMQSAVLFKIVPMFLGLVSGYGAGVMWELF